MIIGGIPVHRAYGFKDIKLVCNMKTIDDVRAFLERFFRQEHKLHVDRKSLVSSRSEYIDRVYDFLDNHVFFTAEDNFGSLTAWPVDEDESSRKKYISDILRERKVFVIEQYQDAKYDNVIQEEGTSDIMFLCYVSDNHEIANHRYADRFFVAETNGHLKIIATEQIISDGSWKEFREFKSIEDFGQFVKAKKIQAPSREEDLKHYNSL